MESLISEIIQPLMIYMAVTFLAVEVLKAVAGALGRPLGRFSVVASIIIGILMSYGWTLSILPEPARPGFQHLSVILTGLVIAGGASGLFSWVKTVSRSWTERGR